MERGGVRALSVDTQCNLGFEAPETHKASMGQGFSVNCSSYNAIGGGEEVIDPQGV